MWHSCDGRVLARFTHKWPHDCVHTLVYLNTHDTKRYKVATEMMVDNVVAPWMVICLLVSSPVSVKVSSSVVAALLALGVRSVVASWSIAGDVVPLLSVAGVVVDDGGCTVVADNKLRTHKITKSWVWIWASCVSIKMGDRYTKPCITWQCGHTNGPVRVWIHV